MGPEQGGAASEGGGPTRAHGSPPPPAPSISPEQFRSQLISSNISPERFRSQLSRSNISPRAEAPAGAASLLMMQPPVVAASSGPVARTPTPSAGGPEASPYSPLSPWMTQPPAAATSASSGLLMRKSLQGLLARVHDVTNFVTEAAATAPPRQQPQPTVTVQAEGVGGALHGAAGDQGQQSFGSSISRDDQQATAAAAGGFPQQASPAVGHDGSAAELADRLAGLSQALAAFASSEAP